MQTEERRLDDGIMRMEGTVFFSVAFHKVAASCNVEMNHMT